MTGTAVEVVSIASIDDVEFSTPFSATIGGALARRYRALVTQGAPLLTA